MTDDRDDDAAPGSRVVVVDDDASVQALARQILDPGRSVPIVALTSRQGEREPALDPDEVIALLADAGDLRVIATGPLTRSLEAALPDKLGVFGGAARIWWPGVTEHSDPYDHPLLQDRYGVYGSKVLHELRAAWDKGPPSRQAVVDNPALVLAHRERDAERRRAERLADELRERTLERDRWREHARALQRERAPDPARRPAGPSGVTVPRLPTMPHPPMSTRNCACSSLTRSRGRSGLPRTATSDRWLGTR
jgi:hypothetical protein